MIHYKGVVTCIKFLTGRLNWIDFKLGERPMKNFSKQFPNPNRLESCFRSYGTKTCMLQRKSVGFSSVQLADDEDMDHVESFRSVNPFSK